jgi:ACS family glucarate transporter-like MFS transporter
LDPSTPAQVPRRLSGEAPRTGSAPVRYKVVAFAVALAGVTYLDRVCIGVLAPEIQRDLNLTPVQMGWVFSAFTLAYGIFEMPTAWWADRIGSRRVLTRIVVWWSAFTMLTAAAFNYVSLLATRFLFGVGEAGAWPNAGRIFSRWIPRNERGRVQGIFFAGAHLAGGLTPALVRAIAVYLPWRAVFVAFGFVGIGWAAAFYRWFRDEPREHAAVSPEERDYIERGRGTLESPAGGGARAWSRVFGAPGLLPLCLQYFANTYGFYFFITWLPSYLATARGMQSAELAIFAGLPLTLSALADITGGMTADAMARRFGVRRGYCAVGGAAYLLAAALMLAGTLSPHAQLSGVLIAVAGALSMFTLAPSWATAIGVGGPNAGLMGAVMNTAGQAGGFLSPIVLAYIVDGLGDWNLPLHLLSGLYLAAAMSWIFIRPDARAR